MTLSSYSRTARLKQNPAGQNQNWQDLVALAFTVCRGRKKENVKVFSDSHSAVGLHMLGWTPSSHHSTSAEIKN